MKRNAKQSSRSSGSGSRLRLTLLLATAAALLLVPAAQALANGTMTVKVTGTGSGEVVSGNQLELYKGTPPIACSYASPGPATGVCNNELSLEEELEATVLNEKPANGSAFAGWTIDKPGFGFLGCGVQANCEPYAFEEEEPEIEVSAVFNKAFTVKKEGGEGTVTGESSGIVCGPSKASCSAEYTGPETLTASPAAGYAFVSWSGCATKPTALTCTVTATATTTVKAKFVATPSLKITKAGTGAGKVTATGIGCDENCSEAWSAVKTGTLVKVTATPAKGSEAAILESGTGNASSCSTSPCEFTISENSSVVVKFNPIPTNTLTVNLTGPGKYKGKVTGTGTLKGLLSSKVNCGSGCTTQTESFFSTDTVTLTAVAATGYSFAGWKGSVCESFGTAPCPVATSSPKTVNAEFK